MAIKMQYFKPQPENLSVGDCMPFFHDGIFHLFYLLDEDHHHKNDGLGGHIWEHASTSDLRNWIQHPSAVLYDLPDEASICTGSVFHNAGVYYAFYSTRYFDRRGEILSCSASSDCTLFRKTDKPLIAGFDKSGYSRKDFRDSVVFHNGEDNSFHMLATSAWEKAEALPGYNGCLAHLVSDDFKKWTPLEPFFIPGYETLPECPDIFQWNKWHYLLFSIKGVTHYRMARNWNGPWLKPPHDTLDGLMARVFKTAPFTGNRRLAVAFVPTVKGDSLAYAGRAVFRELLQYPDGTLGTCFPAEMQPEDKETAQLSTIPPSGFNLNAESSMQIAELKGIPDNAHISMRIKPAADTYCLKLGLRGETPVDGGIISFYPKDKIIIFQDKVLAKSLLDNIIVRVDAVEDISQDFILDIYLYEDVIDICVNGRQCLLNCLEKRTGGNLFLMVHCGSTIFDEINVAKSDL
ncbi:MAG: hypothetical protein WC071_12975 [Victivallaceae bacterium]